MSTQSLDADAPDLPPEALYLPFEAGPHRMAMALSACHPDALLEIDEHYRGEMAQRRALLAEQRGDVFAACAVSERARTETLERLAELLPRQYPGWFRREGPVLHNRLTGESWHLDPPSCDPLELAGRLVQEDLCLIEASGAAPTLQAAILCAPSRWRLAEKIGRPLATVHEAVPLYADRLAAPVDRFMTQLRPGKLTERLNWSVVDDPALFQVAGKHRTEAEPAITAWNAGHRLFLRVERQTLSRLPESGFVLFAIRVHVYPVARVAADPAVARRLAAAVEALPSALAVYKSVPTFRGALLDYLAQRPGHGSCALRVRT